MKKEFEKRILSSLILIPTAFFFLVKGFILFLFLMGIFFTIAVYEWLKIAKYNSIKLFGFLFLLFSFYTAYLLRTEIGLGTFLLIIIICIFTDIGGYISGKTFKGPKLTKISPNKTYSGMFGSFILSIIGTFIFLKYSNFISSYLPLSSLKNNNLYLILFILFISAVSQIGDLIISYFKRLSKVKNTGNILPGHGGLLDRIDGIIFAIPTSYLLIKFFEMT